MKFAEGQFLLGHYWCANFRVPDPLPPPPHTTPLSRTDLPPLPLLSGLRPKDGTTRPFPLEAYVTLTASNGLSHTFDEPIIVSGRPRIARLLQLPGAPAPCDPHPPTALRGCPSSGTAFAVQGDGLVGFGAPVITVGPFACPTVRAYNATYITCEGLDGHGQQHPVRVAVQTLPSPLDLAVALSFLDPCAGRVGHWEGPWCVVCRRGFHGPDCTARCPGAAPDGSAACTGHGRCDDGARGTGECACDGDAVRGFWAGSGCGACADGWYGANCTEACPAADPYGIGVALVCSARGTCGPGGRCDCVVPYAGRACDVRCPVDGGRVCGGHGDCVADRPTNGRCVCHAGPGTGHWAGAECGHCLESYLGPNCTEQCLGQPRPCTGHGRCVWAQRAVCVCDGSWAGHDCAYSCPSGPDGVCGGHGTCIAGPGAAACACDAANATGHWRGATCDVCASGWTGARCDVPCPRGPGGATCSSRGNCTREGKCACAAGTCGAACEREALACAAVSCPNGFYGRTCEGVCNCSASGVCFDGPFGTGDCLCLDGWAGARCASVWPLQRH